MIKEKPKTLFLDIKKWRCGQHTVEGKALGKGNTKLKNDEGYKCCLGFFCEQLGVRKILNEARPEYTKKEIPLLTRIDKYGEIDGTSFTSRAIEINDSTLTKVSTKVKKLTALCAEEGVQLIIKNEHLIPK